MANKHKVERDIENAVKRTVYNGNRAVISQNVEIEQETARFRLFTRGKSFKTIVSLSKILLIDIHKNIVYNDTRMLLVFS